MNILIKKLKSGSFHYAWVIVAIASMSYFFSGPGQTYFISLFIDEYINTYQWDRSVIASLYSGATLLSGLLMFFVGKISDRLGKKRILVMAVVLLALACLWNSFIVAQWMLLIGFFFARFSGQGSMTLVPSTLVPIWFDKRRGLAMSIVSIGGIIGGATIPVINALLMGSWGWQWAFRFWAIILAGFFVPIVLIFLRDHPKDIGLTPYSKEQRDIHGLKVQQSALSYSLRQAMRKRTFWLMMFCQMIFPMVGTGVVFHLVSIVGQHGIDRTQTAILMSIISIVAFPSTFIAGILLDKVPVRFVVIAMFMIYIGGLVILLFTTNIWIAGLFAICQGIITGVNSVCFAYMWPAYFGTEHLGSIRGLSMTATVMGSAIGPLPFGFLFVRTGDYSTAIITMIIITAVGAGAALLARPPAKNESPIMSKEQ